MPDDDDSLTPHPARQRADDALLADLTATPSVEQARESYQYWSRRRGELPIHRQSERKEAEEMATRWKARLAEAEREQYGPGLYEQLTDILRSLGIRHIPSPRPLIVGAGVIVSVTVVLLVAAIVAIVVFWPEIAPIVNTFQGGQE